MKSRKERPYEGSLFTLRLSELMKQTGDTTISLGAYLERTPSAITHWLAGAHEPMPEMVDKIATRYNVNPLWLTGKDGQEKSSINIDAWDKASPIILSSSAFDEIEENIEYEDMEPIVPKGSTIFIKNTIRIESGKVALVIYEGKRYVRRFLKDENAITLAADKPGVLPIVLSGAKKKKLTIVGQVVRVTYSLE